MMHSMAVGGEAPKALSQTNRNGSPVNTLLVCAVILLGGSMLGLFAQDQLFRVLLAVPGFVVMLVWICIATSQLKLRKSYPVQPSFKVWGFPYVTGAVVLCLSVIAVMFVFDESNRFSISICLSVLAVLIIWSLIRFRKTNGRA
jgi:AAT family amino acid transporter